MNRWTAENFKRQQSRGHGASLSCFPRWWIYTDLSGSLPRASLMVKRGPRIDLSSRTA